MFKIEYVSVFFNIRKLNLIKIIIQTHNFSFVYCNSKREVEYPWFIDQAYGVRV
jgi:hypothetical protein